ncbi:MAG TPA: YfiR family protein [Bacteroidales bacterium]|jgi:hypothetical protein
MKTKNTFLILCLLLAFGAKSFSQSTTAKDQSKFIYNFTREIEWPSDYKSGSFTILVLGSAEVYGELKNYLNDKTVAGQHIILKSVGSIEEINKCHVLFVGKGNAQDIQTIRKKLSNSKTLIITDKKEGVRDGAGISFVTMSGRLNYEISPENIVKMGLKYSPDLVDMAVDVPLASR